MITEQLLDEQNFPPEGRTKSAPIGKLFYFTPEEEIAIRRAIRKAVTFMKGFGQAPPQQQIDISHYDNIIKTKWYGR